MEQESTTNTRLNTVALTEEQLEQIGRGKNAAVSWASVVAATYATGASPAVIARTAGISLLILGILYTIQNLSKDDVSIDRSGVAENASTSSETPSQKESKSWKDYIKAIFLGILALIGFIWDFLTSAAGLIMSALALLAKFLLPVAKEDDKDETMSKRDANDITTNQSVKDDAIMQPSLNLVGI